MRLETSECLVSGGLLNARWVQLNWIAVQMAECRRHGRVSHYAWRPSRVSDAAADE